MLRTHALLAALFCLVLFSGSLAYGQSNGSISGTVRDTTASVLSGAAVKITSQGTGLIRDTKTDDSGHYLVPLLPVAFYTVHVEAQGFQPVEEKDVRLQVNEQRELDFTLKPASVSSTVEVTATEVAVQTTNPTLGQVITSEQVADLPLNGRNFVQLATLTPGTTQQSSPNSFFTQASSSEVAARGAFSLSVGGSREQSTDWMLDNNFNGELTSGGIAVLPTIDSIQEFKVLTYNYSAEYGTRAGPTVLVTTKSGSNSWHGAVYEYFRNTSLDARSYFAAFREKFNLNQFGGSLGGPIQKDKTFFFVNYEAKRQRHGIPFTGTVPTQAMMNGDFTGSPFINGVLTNPYANLNGQTKEPTTMQCDPSGNPMPVLADGSQSSGTPCAKVPTTGGPTGTGLVDPIGQALLNLYPVGSPTFTSLGNYANVPVRKLDEGNATIRMDHNFSSKDSAFARFSYDQANSFVPGGSPTWAEQNPFGSNQQISNHGRNIVLSETHILNSNNINQFYFGYNRIFNHINSFGEFGAPPCMAANLGILGADLNSKCPNAPPGLTQSTKDCLSCGLNSVSLAQYWALGDRGFAPFQGGTNVYSFSDTFDMIRGHHEVRVGMGIRLNQMNVMTNGFQDGFVLVNGAGPGFGASFTGDNAADILLGQIDGSFHDQTFYGATTGRRWKMFRPFVQDDWRVTNNLTLNLGLAWALVTPITEEQNRQANFNFTTKQFVIAGKAPFTGCTNCVHSDGAVGIQFQKNAFEPRIGLAWKPFGSQTTAIRAGYAIYHDSGWNQGAQGLWQNPPYYAETDNFNYGVGFPCPFGNWTLGVNSTGVQPCGLKYSFMVGNGSSLPLTPYLKPPNPQAFTGTILSQNTDFKQGEVQQFNFNIERQLPGNVVLTAGYAGSRASHILFFDLNLNMSSPLACFPQAPDPVTGIVGPNKSYDPNYHLGCGKNPGNIFPNYPYPNGAFPSVVWNISDKASARYDSLQLKAETKSLRHGLYALLGYTWSRTFDSGMADGDGTTPGAMFWPLPGTNRADWALSQLNVNNQFTASVLYQLPFGRGKHFGADWGAVQNALLGGWQVNVIQKVLSGFPLFMVDGINNSGSNFQWNLTPQNRPDKVGDPNKPGIVPANPNIQCQYLAGQPIPGTTLVGIAPTKVGTKSNWFNPCAFGQPANGKLGTSDRTPFYGPGFVNTDLSLFKNFPIHERYTLQFRSEFFNLFNHPQFGLTGNGVFMQDITSPTFAKVNETVNNPRVIQLALRLDF